MAEIDATHYLRIIWRWRWLVLLAAILAAGASWYAAGSMPRIYRTSLVVMVGEDAANPAVHQDDLLATQRAMTSYMAMARRQPILEATIDALGLPINWRALQDQIVVVRVEGANAFEIRVVDTSATRVQAVANEIGRQLVVQSPTLSNIQQSEERRQFAQRQVDDLQRKIQQAEAELADKQALLGRETSARGVLERQDEIRAIEVKIDNWRTSYATLLPAITQTRAANSLTIIEQAYRPTEPVSPNVPMTIMLAVAVGILLAIGAAFALEFFDDTLRDAEAVARAVSLTVIGSIPVIRRRRKQADKLIVWSDPTSPISEAYRLVRTFVELAGAHETPLVLLVTSPSVGEGKSVTSANLAVSFAQAGRQTILVDGDLRQPSIHQFFGQTNESGLTTLLSPPRADGVQHLDQAVDTALATTLIPNLRLLKSGPFVPNPAEILGGRAMRQVVAALRTRAEIIIVDSPPILPVADTTILATIGVQTLLVAQAGKTRATAVRRALDSLRHANAPIIGIVLNRTSTTMLAYHTYASRQTAPQGHRQATQPRLLRRG
jgi:polysaccharide biosynthesis transport protein